MSDQVLDVGDVVRVKADAQVGVVTGLLLDGTYRVHVPETYTARFSDAQLERVGGRLQTGDRVEVLQSAGSAMLRGRQGVLAAWIGQHPVVVLTDERDQLASLPSALLEEDLRRVSRALAGEVLGA